MTTPIQQIHILGQSLWYDNIQRRLLENGELATLIARGEVRGVTSNPSIFHAAIASSHDYDSALVPLAWSGWGAEQIFWQLAIEDIRAACDLFLPLYQETEAADGYVSLEVNPLLAHQTAATVAQARQLWEWVKRPNLMIKIPATPEGVPAFRQAVAAGINVNVTLVFSIERYREVMDAYLAGLDERLQASLPVDQIASVASFFVSRLDTKVDALLPEGSPLRGKTAIANTKLAYDEFRKVFGGERFARFQSAGCRLQRPLWASTSTKNPAYPDTRYVDELIGPATVNTVPPQTLDAFRDHGKAGQTVTRDIESARKVLADLESSGISISKVTQELEDEGVQAFEEAFTSLLKTIDERRSTAVAQLGPLSTAVARRVAHLEADSVPHRLHDGDPTLWTSDPKGQAEVRIRLGWLGLPETSRAALKEINTFAADVRADGIKRTLLLGMGGSSLAPEVMSLVFQNINLQFSILDSTDPAQVLESVRQFPPENTLYIVSSKSGGTAEINAMLAYFWVQAEKAVGERAGEHFVAVTDPGTTLEALANARGFRAIFRSNPNVGGRYSVLTHFGLVPAALMGIDLDCLLDRAAWMAKQCAADVHAVRSPGLVLGAVLGQAALDGHDKLTLIADETVAPFGAWLEQLIAESSGKQGRGIIVVDGEPVGDPESYDSDRLFVYLRRAGKFDAVVQKLQTAGQPVLVFDIPDAYDLGAEFYRWEIATATACVILRINAFDQPDVQDSKDRTKAKMVAYSQRKELEQGTSVWEKDGIQIFTPAAVVGKDLTEVLKSFMTNARKHDYVAINAYLPRNAEMAEVLQKLRLNVRERTGCATMVGFGPRFLHSTGQLHKGGPDSGLFLQITAGTVEDLEIPGQGMTFGILERAQALGDYEALVARGRRILRIHLPSPQAMKKVLKALF